MEGVVTWDFEFTCKFIAGIFASVTFQAASVNPVDTVMRNGYGNVLLSTIKQAEEGTLMRPSRLPHIGGRDCSGVVVHCGRNVKNFKEGDEVCDWSFEYYLYYVVKV